jgi:hypothetical protein
MSGEHFGLGADGEVWKEYTEIRDRGEDMAKLAFRKYEDGDPRSGQVLATLSMAERIAALTYLLSKAEIF